MISLAIRSVVEDPFDLAVSPSTIDLAAPPSTVSVSASTSGLFVPTYGMPQSQYLDDNGTIQAVVTSTSISPDGSSTSAPMPSVSGGIPIGTYVGLTGDIDADGSSLDVVGAPSVSIQNSYWVNSNGFTVDQYQDFTAAGTGLDFTYGNAVMQIWSQDGTILYMQQQADSCGPQFGYGYPSGCYWSSTAGPGNAVGQPVQLIFSNVNADGSLNLVGNAPYFNVYAMTYGKAVSPRSYQLASLLKKPNSRKILIARNTQH